MVESVYLIGFFSRFQSQETQVIFDTVSSKFDTLSTVHKICFLSFIRIPEVDVNSFKLDALHCTLIWFKITACNIAQRIDKR